MHQERCIESNIYQQKDGVAIGFPLGPVLAGIFMTHSERTFMLD